MAGALAEYASRVMGAVSPIWEAPAAGSRQMEPLPVVGAVTEPLARGVLSALDFAGRVGQSIPAAVGALAGQAYEDVTGDQGMGRRLERDIMGLAEIGAMLSPLVAARVGGGAIMGSRALDVAADARRVAAGGTSKLRVSKMPDGRIVVAPRNGPRTVVDGERELSRAEINEILQDPELNLAYQVANDYSMKTLGVPYELSFDMPESSLVKQAAIGRVYQEAARKSPEYKERVYNAYREQMPEVIAESGARDFDELVAASYQRMADETRAQFEALPIQTDFGGAEYPSVTAMMNDVMGRGNLGVFRGGDRHEFLHNIDPETGLNENEMFRAVHDYFGHGIRGNAFGPAGEEAAYASHSQMYSPLARMGMAAETRGQNSYVNYSPVNAKDAVLAQRLKAEAKGASPERQAEIRAELDAINQRQVFGDQAATILPPEMMDVNYPGGVPDYLRDVISPAEGEYMSLPGVHYSRTGAPIEAVDPRKHGTAHRGQEMDRVYRDPKAPPRGYFYSGTAAEHTPERQIAQNRKMYETIDPVEPLYNLEDDPLGFRDLVQARMPKDADGQIAANLIERLIDEYGFAGYTVPSRGIMSTFQSVPVRPVTE